MTANPRQAASAGHRLNPKYLPLLVPAIMAIAMSLTMSLVQTIARLGFAPNLESAWLTSFAIGVAVAIPTAILIAPQAQRLAGRLTGTVRRSPADISSSTSSEGPRLASSASPASGRQARR